MMNDDEYIDYFLSKGIIEQTGISPDTGEKLYSITEKTKDIMPLLYKEHLDFINSEIMWFWEMGFIDIDLFSDDPMVTLTNKAFMDEEIEALIPEKQWAIIELKRILLNR